MVQDPRGFADRLQQIPTATNQTSTEIKRRSLYAFILFRHREDRLAGSVLGTAGRKRERQSPIPRMWPGDLAKLGLEVLSKDSAFTEKAEKRGESGVGDDQSVADAVAAAKAALGD